jgi:Domain of unknown function (DUF1772)
VRCIEWESLFVFFLDGNDRKTWIENRRGVWMLTRIVQSLALIFFALSVGLSFAHALEMPVKMQYDGPLYVTVQNSLYRFWGPPSPAAFVEAVALLCTAFLAFLRRKQRSSFVWILIAFVLLFLAFPLIFFLFTEPANRIFRAATPSSIPENWMQVRAQWEYSHAARFVLELCGLIALVLSLKVERPHEQIE